jgi:RHS repeat-associated protein
MGESFSAQISTGIATYNVPIGLPKARGTVQPSLLLSYSSSGGFGMAGHGWNIGSSVIARKTDHGMPRFDDRASWHANQDRFTFGGSELVPICIVAAGNCTGTVTGEVMPAWAEGWQYFRNEVESGYYRYFWSPDHRTWRVQAKDGSNLEFGVPLDGSGYDVALENNPSNPREIVRWHLVRQYDSHGVVNQPGVVTPYNVVVYRYFKDGNVVYLSDIYDTSPATDPATLDLTRYSHHARLVYDERPDKLVSFRAGWRMDHQLRIQRIDVAAKPFNSTTAPRQLLRRYHFGYDPQSHTSLLESFQQEGRCTTPIEETAAGALPNTVCPRLPALTFEYQRVQSELPAVTDSAGLKYEPFASAVQSMPNSPPHSLGQMETGLMDVNGDSLPDVIVTSAAVYKGSFGLFFNGASGTVGFEPMRPMTVTPANGVDAGILKLSNKHVSALDLDADGRVNLVHMPDFQRYSVFSPNESGGNWTWTSKSVSAPIGQSFKIDFTKNAEHSAVMDVNGDGLVDIVYASATEMQTFFALGRFAKGDGVFGQGEWTSASEAKLSTDPVRSCVPWSASPVRIGDRDVHVADMNGDGLPDIVRIRNGQALYWPGRGNGTWGTGERSDCVAGTFGSDRAIQMTNAPYFNALDSSELFVSDVNGDGLTDLIKVRVSSVDIYLNENGLGFANRGVLSDTPVHPNTTRRVALTDINGSGTPDLLWGEAHNYSYIDLTAGIQPLLLRRTHNGLGVTTELEYSTSTQLMLAADAGGDRWATTMPMVVPVVVRSTVRDNLERVGRPGGAALTEYRYRDPIFDGKARDFRGFREAIVRSIGDANSPTDLKRSEFLLGHSSDDHGAITTADSEPWRAALKGAPVVEEELDETGTARLTRHTSHSLRALYQGLDGRKVWSRGASTVDVFAYDTANFDHSQTSVAIADYSVDLGSSVVQSTRQLGLRATAGTARLRSSTVIDNFGNVTTNSKEGCISGCPAGTDETITTTSNFARPTGDLSGWLWRETDSYITGSAHPTPRHRRGSTYNSIGEVTETHAWLSGTLVLQRSMTNPPAPPNASQGQTGEVLVTLSTVTRDELGNPILVQGPHGSCHSIQLDDEYAEFVVEDNSFAGNLSVDGCGEQMFTTTASYDRGLGQPVTVVSAQNQPSSVLYDGFGRVVAEYGPSLTSPGSIDPQPRRLHEYFPTPNALTQPYSAVRSQTIDESPSGTIGFVEDVVYVDGLGRTIFTVREADPEAGDGGKYLVSGGALYTAKGIPYVSYEPFFHTGPAIGFPINTVPSTNTKRQLYDAYGRTIAAYLQDGQLKSTAAYHALGADSFDAGALSTGTKFSGTYSTQYSDGHGRGVIGINRFLNGATMEEHRTTTTYLPSGEVVSIRQQRAGSSDFTRTFEYDSWGRMVHNVEPNTSLTTGSGASQVIKAWRYAYDNASRLVGTSDANGCGVNYHYDAGGRIVGSDYLPCKSNQVAYSAPNASTGDGFESFYRYDTPDPLATNVTDAAGQSLAVDSRWTWGRVASVKTRGAFNVFAYDALGRTIGAARRVARPGNSDPVVTNRYAPRWYVKQSAFDIADRPRRVSTGAPLLALFGTDGTSEQRISYTRRGQVRSVGSSYGNLLARQLRDARGLVTDTTFGDVAQTKRSYTYNELTQVTDVTTYRAPASLWTTGASPYVKPPALPNSTTQLTLEHYGFQYDVMGNLTRADDWRTGAEWPDANRPVTRTWEYDSYSRLTKTTYTYPGSSNSTWQAPFSPENASSTLEPRPAPQVSFSSRVTQEDFTYDWLNNLVTNTDDKNGFYDRSIGTASFGTSGKPHRLTASSNRSTGATRQGELAVAYDDVGQVTAMIIQRNGTCLPSGANCWTRFAYEWDEVGNLTRARRWDLTAGTERTSYGSASSVGGAHPTRAPDAEMKYQYDGGSRVVKTSSRSSGTKYTVYPFSTLELRGVGLTGTGAAQDYTLSTDTTQLRIGGGGVTGRVLYNATMPRPGSSQVHLFLEFGDQLGSTTFTIDHDTSEIVEYVTYTAYGQTENDYRTSRWSNFREPYRFTGKEDDVEVGLSYHGARYYSPALKRWMSTDPVTIHGVGSDVNPYAYGYGNPTSYVDPDGRLPILAGVVIAAIVSATTNAIVQNETTGHVNWNSVFGAFVGGAAAAVGGAASSVFVGFVGFFNAVSQGGSSIDGLKAGLIGAATASIGAAVSAGVAHSFATNGVITPAAQFAGQMGGTAYATLAGVGMESAAWGREPTWQSLGRSFGTAFAGTIASTALSNGIESLSTSETEGNAAEAGAAAGKAAHRSSAIQEALRSASRFSQDPRGNNIIMELLSTGVPKPTIGQVISGEPITDPYVKDALYRAWNDTKPWSEATREQGGWGHPIPESSGEYWVERWPEGTRGYIDRGTDSWPDRNSFSFHSHGLNEWHDPTYTRQSASLGDWLMFRQFQMHDPAHIHYVLSTHGIYRLSGNQQQWIAPIGYLAK